MKALNKSDKLTFSKLLDMYNEGKIIELDEFYKSSTYQNILNTISINDDPGYMLKNTYFYVKGNVESIHISDPGVLYVQVLYSLRSDIISPCQKAVFMLNKNNHILLDTHIGIEFIGRFTGQPIIVGNRGLEILYIIETGNLAFPEYYCPGCKKIYKYEFYKNTDEITCPICEEKFQKITNVHNIDNLNINYDI